MSLYAERVLLPEHERAARVLAVDPLASFFAQEAEDRRDAEALDPAAPEAEPSLHQSGRPEADRSAARSPAGGEAAGAPPAGRPEPGVDLSFYRPGEDRPRYLESWADVDSEGQPAVEGGPLDELAFRGPTRQCDPSWGVVTCRCGPKPVRIGCQAEDCLDCTTDVTRRRTRSAWRRVEPDLASRARPMLYTVFTVPPERRVDLTQKDWASWRRRIVKRLKEGYGFRYGIVSTHPTGEDMVTFHPHLNVLWLQTSESRPFLDVASLAADWQNIIGSEGRGVMHHTYSYEKGKQKHWLRYVLRPFPGWSHWRGRALRWYWLKGQLPKAEGRTAETCPVCEQPYLWFGLCADEAGAHAWADSIAGRRAVPARGG